MGTDPTRDDIRVFENRQQIESVVRGRFNVKDMMIREDGYVEYKIGDNSSLKESFAYLVRELRQYSQTAMLRRVGEDIILYTGKSPKSKPFNRRIPLALFLATLTTVTVDGFFRVSALPQGGSVSLIFLYTIGLMGILGVHELGHKIASSRHGIRSSYPYFIPGLPGFLPTFGAVIKSGEPPANRDSLFDLGISGPIAGLAVTFLVAIGGALTSVSLSSQEMSRRIGDGTVRELLQTDIFTNYLLGLTVPQGEGMGILLSPLSFAASLGFLVTFLNLLPAWQLDGGHVARAAVSSEVHRALTWATIIVMILLGFGLMALLVLFMSFRAPAMQPLDDVSRLSRGRRVAFVFVLVLAAGLYYFTIMNNPFFFPSA